MLWHISKWRLSPSSSWKHEGTFLQHSLFTKLLEIKFTSVGSLVTGPSWRFWLVDLSALGCQQFINYSWGFSPLAPMLMKVSAPVSCDSLSLPVCLSSFGGQPFTLWPRLSDRSKSRWFFSWLNFLPVVKMECWLPSSYHARAEKRSPCWINLWNYMMKKRREEKTREGSIILDHR